MRAFSCIACGASEAIVLPADASVEIVCPKCHARQPRRAYEVLRLQADFARARAGAPPAPSVDHADESASCPSCGDDLFTAAHGCPRCGHGRPSFAARSPGLVAGIAAGAAAVLGGALLFTVGTVSQQAPWMHALLLGMSMTFLGVGVYAVQRPKGLPLAANTGTDAFGMQTYGPTQPSTTEQGSQTGVVMIAVGIGMLILGVFFGALAG